MAFCGQCGLLLNTNITRCPRCGTEAHPDAALPGIPTNDNAATIIARNDGSTPYTPLPPTPDLPPHDATKAVYYTGPAQPDFPPGDNSYPTPGTFDPCFPQSGSNYMTPGAPSPNALPGNYNQAPAPGIYPPGVFPTTDPSYPFQQATPPRKTHKGLIAIIIILLVALIVVTGLLFAVGTNRFPRLFGTKSTPITLVTPTIQSAVTITPDTQPTATVATTPQTTAIAEPTQQAQTTIQLYYDDINSQNFHDAYYLWVSNPDTYDHFQQGFAHTHHDAITFGDAVAQTDGTIQVNLAVQATEDATGGGTHVSVYHGYYTVGQQADGSWKIINGQLS